MEKQKVLHKSVFIDQLKFCSKSCFRNILHIQTNNGRLYWRYFLCMTFLTFVNTNSCKISYATLKSYFNEWNNLHASWKNAAWSQPLIACGCWTLGRVDVKNKTHAHVQQDRRKIWIFSIDLGLKPICPVPSLLQLILESCFSDATLKSHALQFHARVPFPPHVNGIT